MPVIALGQRPNGLCQNGRGNAHDGEEDCPGRGGGGLRRARGAAFGRGAGFHHQTPKSMRVVIENFDRPGDRTFISQVAGATVQPMRQAQIEPDRSGAGEGHVRAGRDKLAHARFIRGQIREFGGAWRRKGWKRRGS